MNGTITAKKAVTHPYLAMICFLSVSLILPRFGSVAIMLGCASIFTVLVSALPEKFHSRNGSLLAAICLVGALWVGVTVITALVLMGAIRD